MMSTITGNKCPKQLGTGNIKSKFWSKEHRSTPSPVKPIKVFITDELGEYKSDFSFC